MGWVFLMGVSSVKKCIRIYKKRREKKKKYKLKEKLPRNNLSFLLQPYLVCPTDSEQWWECMRDFLVKERKEKKRKRKKGKDSVYTLPYNIHKTQPIDFTHNLNLMINKSEF